MKRMLPRLALAMSVAVALAAMAGVEGCKKKSDATGGSGGGTATTGKANATKPFRYVNRGDVITLDLNQVSYLQDFRVLYAIREGLYCYNPDNLKAEPALAEKTEVSADKKTWTFKLRDAKWSNGDPVVAGDFVFSWKHMLEAEGEYTYLFSYIKGAPEYIAAASAGKPRDFANVGIRAPDEKTLVVELTDPVVFLPDLMAFPPFYPRHAKSMEPFKKVTGDKTTYDDAYTRPPAVITNGPFTLEEWDLGRRLTFKKSQNYWDKEHVLSDSLEMVVNNDPLSAFQMFDSNEIDWLADVQPTIAVDLKDAGRKELHIGPGFGLHFITFNCLPSVPGVIEKNPLADMRVRQALAYAVEKKTICGTITRMGETPAGTYVPPGIFEGYTPQGAQPYDVAKAKQLLAEAGYPDGKGFPPLPIIYNTDNKTREQIAQVLKNQWQKNLGISVEIRGLELTGGYKPAVSGKRYAIALVAWFGDYTDPSTFTDKYQSKSRQNDAAWVNAAYDKLLDDATKEGDAAKRVALLEKAEEMLNTEAPIVPLYFAVNYSLYRDNVKGIVMNPKQLINWKRVKAER